MMAESPPQAQQGFAEPPRITMYSTKTQLKMAESDSQPHRSGTQQKKVTESGSPYTQDSETHRKRWLSLALHTHTAQGLSKEDG